MGGLGKFVGICLGVVCEVFPYLYYCLLLFFISQFHKVLPTDLTCQTPSPFVSED